MVFNAQDQSLSKLYQKKCVLYYSFDPKAYLLKGATEVIAHCFELNVVLNKDSIEGGQDLIKEKCKVSYEEYLAKSGKFSGTTES